MIRKQQSLALEVKQKILNEISDGILKKTEIATKYGVANSTISMILKNREKIEAAYASGSFEPVRKRIRTGRNEDVEVSLLRWIREARIQNLPLSGAVLQEKAKFFADALGLGDFSCSNGWLQRFKERHGICCKRICGEEASVDQALVASFFTGKWAEIKKDYAPRDIFNADETGLFFKALPERTLALKNEKCSGGKFSKERITVLVCCNMDGTEKLPLLVIGKSAKPRCFKGVKTLPLQYSSSKKAWMNSHLFTNWIKDLDKNFRAKKRKICLLLDNCRAHAIDVQNLKAIKCVFLPPNTTAKMQPCDQGIIQCIKVRYRQEIVQKLVHCYDSKKKFSVDILQAMVFLKNAWDSVSAKTIENCYRHAGFSSKEDSSINANKTPDITTAVVKAAKKRGLLNECDFNDYVCVDEQVITSGILTENDIVSDVKGDEDTDEYDIDDEQFENTRPIVSLAQASEALETLNTFLLQQENSASAMNSLHDVNKFWTNCNFQKMKQSTIVDYFKQQA